MSQLHSSEESDSLPLPKAAQSILGELRADGAAVRETWTTVREIGNRTEMSIDVTREHLRWLAVNGYIRLTIVEGGILVKITSPELTGDDAANSSCEKFTGLITDGKGEGKHFVKLQGYARQFQQKLGYDPYPGTLNVDLTSGSIRDLDPIPAICINAWSTDEKTFGAVYCYPAIIKGESGTTHKPAHIIVPERTSHDNTTLEIIAPTELRSSPEIETNKQVTVHV